mmetsp:Transcript_55325/g.89463  ORF Transcript_55325/g.89463 Transcript_55325/m.89463 type:complete len:385 (+) Transcript_55325:69-1223(+)
MVRFLPLLFLAVHVGAVFGDAAPMTAVTSTASEHIKYYNDLVESLPSLQGKCVAITGTTSGLGYWAALATVKKNASCLIMLNRQSKRSVTAEDEIRKQALPGVAVITVTCDLENISSVHEAAANVNHIVSKFGGLDVLALNAGIMSQPDTRTADGYDVTMQTNHLSHFLLTKLLMTSLQAAARNGHEVRIVTHSSLTRGTSKTFEGGGPVDAKYYMKSPAGTLGGDGDSGSRERYHQSKLANIIFAMALHSRFARAAQYSNFKALAAAPGFADTSLKIPAAENHPWIKDLVALSAEDGSCSILTAMYAPSAKSGDFYEPEYLSIGPPIKVIAQGVPLSPHFPRHLTGIRDQEVCDEAAQAKMWNATEVGLGETFVVEEPLLILV